MTIVFYPKGTCSRLMTIDTEDGIIRSVKVEGGCLGNLQGVSSLVQGMKIVDVIEKLDGIHCGDKPTSCPDQLAKALKTL